MCSAGKVQRNRCFFSYQIVEKFPHWSGYIPSSFTQMSDTPGLRIALPEEATGKLLQKCEQINILGITVNTAFSPSANVLASANKARGMLYFIKRSFTCLTKEIFVPLCSALVRPHPNYAIQANCPYLKKDIYHLERIKRVKGLRGLTCEERLQALKLQPLGKRRLRNDLVLTHKILYNHIDLDATQLLKYSRRPGLRRSSIRLLHQTGRTRRRRNSFACKVINNWNRLPFAVASVTEQRKFKQLLDSYVYS